MGDFLQTKNKSINLRLLRKNYRLGDDITHELKVSSFVGLKFWVLLLNID